MHTNIIKPSISDGFIFGQKLQAKKRNWKTFHGAFDAVAEPSIWLGRDLSLSGEGGVVCSLETGDVRHGLTFACPVTLPIKNINLEIEVVVQDEEGEPADSELRVTSNQPGAEEEAKQPKHRLRQKTTPELAPQYMRPKAKALPKPKGKMKELVVPGIVVRSKTTK